MKRFFFAACTMTLGAASAWAAANPQLLRLLPPDSKAIAGIDVAHAKASAFGQFLLLQAGPSTDLDKLKATTGFDPRTDLLELVAGSVSNASGIAVGFGAFPVARLTTLAQTAGTPTSTYRGITLISAGNTPAVPGTTATPTSSVAAFLDGSTFAIGATDSVKAAIDRWIGGAPASGALMQKAIEVGATLDAWAVATSISELAGTPASPAVAPLGQQAAIAQNIASKIESLSAGLEFGNTNVTVHGQVLTRSTQDAQAIADVFQLALAMVGPQATNNPLFNALQFAPNGPAVNFTLTLTEQQAEDLIKPKRSTPAPARAVVLE
jgi:opacity protein-like surface antigen